MGKIVVIGSINLDLVVEVDEIPKIGETVMGNSLSQIPGGKGANQAVAMAKLGCDVDFLGKVGNDNFSSLVLESMRKSGVNTRNIETEDTSTGIAIINVDKKANNNIIVIPGANGKVDETYLLEHEEIIKNAEVVVFQLEIPIDTVKFGLKLAKRHDKLTILNPAPAYELDDEIIENVDIIIPNEHELSRLTHMEINDENDLTNASKALIERKIKKIIVTLGEKGALYVDKNTTKLYPSYKVKAVDSTAAGDAFIGGFVGNYIQTKDIDKAIDMGQRTAAIAIQRFGAQTSLPTLEEVLNFK
ncbi:MAG TPA: ribokinase [Soehngenia sp.]|mgnify:CR=1 FL=1|nr:ribokinase [Soehngenia sp.]